MKKLFLFSLLLVQVPGCGNLEQPDGWDVANDFMNKWWEYDILGNNGCFILSEDNDEGLMHPIFTKDYNDDEQDLFGVWEFSPPSTFHVYEDGQEPPFDIEIFDGGECWTIKWGSIEETVCPCSF